MSLQMSTRLKSKVKNKQTLSVVLATFNEESNIAACLLSVSGLADEIIVYDESSTDKTREIAISMGAVVYKTHHEPIFHVTKNKAIVKAKGKWILQLDADERLTPELKQEINTLLEGKYFGYSHYLTPAKRFANRFIPLFPPPVLLSAPASAYYLPRRNWFLTRYLKHTGQYPDPVIRLFQRGLASLPAKDVHEQMQVDGSIGWMTGDLDHYSTPTFSRYILRENRYSSLHAIDLYQVGIRPSIINTVRYLILYPVSTFLSLYIRHRGFLDGFPGFVFSLFSGLHHSLSYLKLWSNVPHDKS